MKAAMNGVPSLSILDGWWIEAHIEGLTGWSIGDTAAGNDSGSDAAQLYEKLESSVIPTFYQAPERFTDIMRHAIALNGSFFHAQRMLQEYLAKAYGGESWKRK
jgi:starch phosphorylase